MKGFFYSNKILIGEIDYANEIRSKTEIGMGGICGDFLPNENYKLIRSYVQNWNDLTLNDLSKRDWSKWYSLNFNVQLDNGYFLDPAGGFEIQDYTEFPEEPLQVRTAGIHSHIFEDYFKGNKKFLDKCWRKISIEEKFKFEEKFKREVSLSRKLSFRANDSYETSFSSLAQNISNNKVLYTTQGTNKPYFSIVNFAVKDENDDPTFEFYESFDEFLK